MATGRKTVVVGQVIDPTTWGNPLWDQSVQTFASAADRTSQFPTPKQGAVVWLEDVKRLEFYNGTAWVPLGMFGKPVTGTSDAGGTLPPFAHGGSIAPWAVQISVVGGPVGMADAAAQNFTGIIHNVTATTIQIRVRREDTHAWVTNYAGLVFYVSWTWQTV
jgi:hypothetical protein